MSEQYGHEGPHTPAPWEWKRKAYEPWVLGNDYAQHQILTAVQFPGTSDSRLIAAAPDLLEALKGMLLNPDFELSRVLAKRAIAKAEGSRSKPTNTGDDPKQ